jgi:hypothetical protein
MPNVLINPLSSIIEFNDAAAGDSTLDTSLTGASRLTFTDGELNVKSFSPSEGRFSVDGSSGRLFTVSDSLTGTVFSVNDISGLPILQVDSNADDVVTMGSFGTNALVVRNSDVGIGTDQPNEKLTVVGNISATGSLSVGNVSQTLSNLSAASAVHTHDAATTSIDGFMSSSDKTKLDGIATGATACTGTVTCVAATAGTGISVTGSPITGAGTLTITNTSPNATHTGDVTGSTALTIANNCVSNAKLADMPVNTIKGRITTGTGDPEDLTAAQVRTLINVADGAQVNVATNLSYSTAATTGTVNSSTGDNATIPAATTSLAGLMTCTDKTKLDGIAAGAQVNVATNLTYSTAATTGTVNSSTGDNATIPAATTTLAGLMTCTDKTKLDGIATGATACTGTVTSVAATAGTGISVTGSPITGAGTLTITNTSPNATHTGDVTGSAALTIANNCVSNAKLADMPVNTIKGRIAAGTGDPQDLSAAQVRTILSVAPISAVDLQAVTTTGNTTTNSLSVAALSAFGKIIGGSATNTATGADAAVLGGRNNTASGAYSNVAGGRNNCAICGSF